MRAETACGRSVRDSHTEEASMFRLDGVRFTWREILLGVALFLALYPVLWLAMVIF